MAVHGRDFSEIGDDEPCFVIRGQDRAAPEAIRAYAHRAQKLGASETLVRSALDHAIAIELWQAKHGSKVPDLKG